MRKVYKTILLLSYWPGHDLRNYTTEDFAHKSCIHVRDVDIAVFLFVDRYGARHHDRDETRVTHTENFGRMVRFAQVDQSHGQYWLATFLFDRFIKGLYACRRPLLVFWSLPVTVLYRLLCAITTTFRPRLPLPQ